MCSETQFSLKWNNYGSTMTSALNTLHQLEDFVDVTLAVEGIQLKAHKVVLSACSSYFKEILKSNPCQHPVIIFREVAAEDLKSVLSFMYEGEVSVPQPRLHPFMRLAEALKIKGLTETRSSSISYPVNQNLISNSQHQLSKDIDNCDVSSLDLSKKVTKSYSPKTEVHAHSTSHFPSINNGEYRMREHLYREEQNESHMNFSNKRLKTSDNTQNSSSLSLRKLDNEAPEYRVHEKENFLEFKLEPDEFPDSDREKDEKEAELREKVCEREVSNSPSEATNLAKSNDASSPTVSSCPEKKGCNNAARIEKQTSNYQPEFPQDPSCHHSLPYPCPFCEKSYTSWGFRRRHIKGYHAGTPELPCKWCLAVLPSHQDWEAHVTRLHSLTITDARNGILILEEAHMVLQIAQPTRIDSLMELIKNKKFKDKEEAEEKEVDKDKKGERESELDIYKEKEKNKSARKGSKGGESSH